MLHRVMSEQNKKKDDLYNLYTKYSVPMKEDEDSTGCGDQVQIEEFELKANNLSEFMIYKQNNYCWGLDTDKEKNDFLRRYMELGRRGDRLEASWTYHEFTSFLCSADNIIIDPKEKRVHQDMGKTLSEYWINSSNKTYLIDGTESNVKAYEEVLEMGVRCIEMDVYNGTDGPLIYNSSTTFFSQGNKIQLDDVLRTIKDHAFSVSEFPLIISINSKCNEANYKTMVRKFEEILGEKILSNFEADTWCLHYLKNKIILQSKAHLGKEYFRKVNLGTVGLVMTQYADDKGVPKDACVEDETLFLTMKTDHCIPSLYAEPWFLGKIPTKSITKVFNGSIEDGDFVIYLNEKNELILQIHHSGCRKKKATPYVAYQIKANKQKQKFRVSDFIDFNTVQELVAHYQSNTFVHSDFMLKNPIQTNQAHEHMPWYFEDMSQNLVRNYLGNLLWKTNEPGTFLVRKSAHRQVALEYFDGSTVQTVDIYLDENMNIEQIDSELDLNFNVTTIVHFVNQLHLTPLQNGSHLKQTIAVNGDSVRIHRDLISTHIDHQIRINMLTSKFRKNAELLEITDESKKKYNLYCKALESFFHYLTHWQDALKVKSIAFACCFVF